MNELAKAMFRFSWSMSCYGAQQAARLMSGGDWRQASTALEDLGKNARDQVEGPFRNVLETGDRIGNSFLETASDLAAGRAPGVGGTFEDARDALDRSWETLRRNLIPGNQS